MKSKTTYIAVLFFLEIFIPWNLECCGFNSNVSNQGFSNILFNYNTCFIDYIPIIYPSGSEDRFSYNEFFKIPVFRQKQNECFHTSGYLSIFPNHHSENNKDEDRNSGNPIFKPLPKMIISQNSLNIISDISTLSGSSKNLTKRTLSFLFISNIIFSCPINKTFLSLNTFILPYEDQKSILKSNIIIC